MTKDGKVTIDLKKILKVGAKGVILVGNSAICAVPIAVVNACPRFNWVWKGSAWAAGLIDAIVLNEMEWQLIDKLFDGDPEEETEPYVEIKRDPQPEKVTT